MKPTREQVREFVKSEIFKWFLEKIATYANEIDTVRNVESGDELVARKMTIKILENAFSDIYDVGEFAEIQSRISLNEDNPINQIRKLREEY